MRFHAATKLPTSSNLYTQNFYILLVQHAALINLLIFHSLLGVVTTISKLIKSCVLRITPTALYFILSEKAVNGGIQIWCELPQV